MSKVDFTVVYDGPALSNHGIDVADLAPSLMALGDLVKQANFKLNGESATIKLIVRSDFEHKCFLVHLDLVQSIFEQVHGFFTDDRVATAKEIAEWLGILGIPPVGLLTYLKHRNGKKIKDVTTLETTDKHGLVQVTFEGDGNQITVNQNVYLLGEEPSIRKAAASFVAPLEREGFEEIRFTEKKGAGQEIKKEDAAAIRRSHSELLQQVQESYEPQIITAHLQVSRPDFSENAKVWKFRYGDRIVPVDISESTIAEQVRQRGLVRMGDTWRVRMSVTERKTGGNSFRVDYKVIEVLGFTEGAEQQSLFSSEIDNEEEEEGPNREPPLTN